MTTQANRLFTNNIPVAQVYPAQAVAEEMDTDKIRVEKTNRQEEVRALYQRLTDIRRMNKSGIGLTEKKSLSAEAGLIEGQLNKLYGGFYFPFAAFVIILIVLIILS